MISAENSISSYPFNEFTAPPMPLYSTD